MDVCGCSREQAVRAAEAAGDGGVELAVNLVLSMMSTHWASADDIPPPEPSRTKLVCLVRQDLGMGVGKVAAQVAHGVMGAVRATARREGGESLLQVWEAGGEAVIVLAVADHAALESLLADAAAKGLATHCVADAGRTEVAAGSETVGTVGPDHVDKIDAVTGKLPLL